MDHLLNFLHHCQELGTTLLLHDIRVPPPNRGSVHNGGDGVCQGNRFDSTAVSFVCVVGELSSDSADSIQLRYLDKMSKLPKPSPNLVFGVFTGGYGMKICRRLDFNEENGALEIQWLNDIGNHEVDGASTTCLSLLSDVLGCDYKLGGREAFNENTIIKPIELVLDTLRVWQTRGMCDNMSRPRHGGA